MIGWLINLNDASRLTSINEASRISGISAKAIEKDWWVTLSLKLLFNSPYARHFAFKGGTSLSKGWQLIDRFSEDIDISLSSEAVNIEYVEKPSKTFVEQLRRAGCFFTSNELMEALKAEFRNSQVPEILYSIEAESVRSDMPDTDPQTLYVNFISLFDPKPYLPDRVKIEFSVRSLKEPSIKRGMRSLLVTHFPNENYIEENCEILTIQPQRTLIERMLLLHEEYNRDERGKMRTDRMSRHYYDLFQLGRQDFSSATLKDNDFIEEIIEHRKYYSRLKRFDYSTLKRGSIRIIPSDDVLKALEQDYEIMRAEMIYGHPPTFEEIIQSMKNLQDEINSEI
ncbi:MAG: nucleotidyl transferase AbiEii/AbiGii toxin family protein [Saprospiraceae bacterium]|nr:nucleotidyl transferase AbiEii/AbiGii toxin family protein [Saprospiraceae bacterium]